MSLPKVCKLRNFRVFSDTFCLLFASLSMAILLLPVAGQALPNQPISMELCRAKVEGRSLNSVEQLVLLTTYWINNQVDSEKVKQLTDFLNQNPSPANPFENGFELGDVQMDLVFQKLLNQLSVRDWTKYLEVIVDYSKNDHTNREKAKKIDHEESFVNFKIEKLEPTSIKNPHPSSVPVIVTLKNHKSYTFVEVNSFQNGKNPETHIFAIDQEGLKLNHIANLNINELFPEDVELDQIFATIFSSTPIPIDEERFLVSIELKYRDKNRIVTDPLHVFAEVNAITGDSHIVYEMSYNSMKVESNPLFVSEEEIYFANVSNYNESDHHVSFLKVDLKNRQVEEISKLPLGTHVPVQIFQKDNGDIIWIVTGWNNEFLVYTLEKETGLLNPNPVTSNFKNDGAIHPPVFFKTSTGKWIFSVALTYDMTVFTFDPQTNQFQIVGSYPVQHHTEGRQVLFESEKGNIYLATGTGKRDNEKLELLRVDLENNKIHLVDSFETSSEVIRKIKFLTDETKRMFLVSTDLLGNLLLLEFDEHIEKLIKLQKVGLSSTQIGQMVQDGSSLLIPVTYGSSELQVHQVSIGKKK